ncbi:hypothetical protein [Carp edema virus]|nr:hypothetical protein [Carp edema virus]
MNRIIPESVLVPQTKDEFVSKRAIYILPKFSHENEIYSEPEWMVKFTGLDIGSDCRQDVLNILNILSNVSKKVLIKQLFYIENMIDLELNLDSTLEKDIFINSGIGKIMEQQGLDLSNFDSIKNEKTNYVKSLDNMARLLPYWIFDELLICMETIYYSRSTSCLNFNIKNNLDLKFISKNTPGITTSNIAIHADKIDADIHGDDFFNFFQQGFNRVISKMIKFLKIDFSKILSDLEFRPNNLYLNYFILDKISILEERIKSEDLDIVDFSEELFSLIENTEQIVDRIKFILDLKNGYLKKMECAVKFIMIYSHSYCDILVSHTDDKKYISIILETQKYLDSILRLFLDKFRNISLDNYRAEFVKIDFILKKIKLSKI